MSKVATAKPCPGCNGTVFTRDLQATAGDVLCSNCGMVQVENPIVSEVQFSESASGAATVQGSMVAAGQSRVFNARNSLESREQTILNAKSKIKSLAAAMKIPDYIHESAFGWFKLALVQNFVQGRRSQNVIAACLYVACRHEKTHHLLIDFSSRLQISVYSLGATYLKLVRALQIQKLPLADPSLFIQHFAERLGFAEYTNKVCRDATKIAQRMSSDWIYEGRRPAGIAGACLLLAARMNNFRRSHAEIVAVAKVGEETLQKRLNEFKKTSSALLSISKFRDSSNTNDSHPPSFKKNREIEKKVEKLLLQRNKTLERYHKMAKERRLLQHLNVPDLASRALSPEATPAVDDAQTTNTTSKAENSTSQEPTRTDKSEKEKPDDIDSDSETEFVDADDGNGGTIRPSPETPSAQDKTHAGDADTLKNGVTEANQKEKESKSQSEDNSDEEEFNELFLPEDDDDDEFGFDLLPDNDDNADPDFESRHKNIMAERRMRLRSSTLKSSSISRSSRLGSIYDTPAASRRKLLSENRENKTQQRSHSLKKKRTKQVMSKEENDARNDDLLKSVLSGGDIKEEDLEIALDKLLQGQKRALESSLYKTPAEMRNERDLAKQIEMDRPRNLVKNNPTTSEILSRVPDEELLNTDDEDDEVLAITLNEEERAQKERIWIALNHDFLIAQEKKRLKVEADELTGNTSGQPRKRKRVKEQPDRVLDDAAVANAIHSIGEGSRIISPAENAKQMLQRKSFSRKINYSSIGELFNEG